MPATHSSASAFVAFAVSSFSFVTGFVSSIISLRLDANRLPRPVFQDKLFGCIWNDSKHTRYALEGGIGGRSNRPVWNGSNFARRLKMLSRQESIETVGVLMPKQCLGDKSIRISVDNFSHNSVQVLVAITASRYYLRPFKKREPGRLR